jgi:ribosomal protein S18 acetylase RimI-like enzyme
MFEFIKKLFKKTETPDIPRKSNVRPDGFQLATLYDTDTIFRSILEESHAGHFSSNYIPPMAHPGLKHQLIQGVRNGTFPSNSKSCEAAIFVFIEKDKAIAFSWAIQRTKNEVELYLIAVSPDHRRRGIGTLMVEHSIKHFTPGTTFIVRLYKKSTSMLKIVKTFGFTIAKSRGHQTTTLSYTS